MAHGRTVWTQSHPEDAIVTAVTQASATQGQALHKSHHTARDRVIAHGNRQVAAATQVKIAGTMDISLDWTICDSESRPATQCLILYECVILICPRCKHRTSVVG